MSRPKTMAEKFGEATTSEARMALVAETAVKLTEMRQEHGEHLVSDHTMATWEQFYRDCVELYTNPFDVNKYQG